MTPKEKAKELVYKYYNAMNPYAPDCSISFNQVKQCALISIANEISSILWLSILCTFDNPMKEYFNNKLEELKQVEKEINEL